MKDPRRLQRGEYVITADAIPEAYRYFVDSVLRAELLGPPEPSNLVARTRAAGFLPPASPGVPTA
jgi:hypothetical protein